MRNMRKTIRSAASEGKDWKAALNQFPGPSRTDVLAMQKD
jgi:hypothetical protein